MQTLFLDMIPSSPLSGTNTAVESCEIEPQTDGSPTCTCGKGTSGCLTHPSTRDEWTSYMQDFLARTLAALGTRPDSAMERAAAFTEKCSELLTSFDPDTSSWKMSQQSLLTNGLEPFSETWPRAGTMRGGRVYRHLQPVPRTTVIGGGCLQNVPTPRALDHKGGRHHLSMQKAIDRGYSPNLQEWVAGMPRMWQTPVADDAHNRKDGKWNSRGEPKLSAQVKIWPTPCANAYKGSSPAALTRTDGRDRSADRLDHAVMASDGGQLNPDWVCWLMGFPLVWFEGVKK